MIDSTVVFDVAIVGGGASGVLAAIHLLRRCPPGARIALLSNATHLGEGIAYSTRRPEHLLNVTAGRMSAFEDDPGHFVRYLKSLSPAVQDEALLRDTFAPRRQFAEYLRHTLGEVAAAHATGALNVIAGEAVAIEGDDRLTVTGAEGSAIQARAVVLAVGNWPRQAAHAGAADARVSGWDFEAVARIGADEDVAIVGSGLSMVDAVLTLAANAHRGAIHVISRHGLLPRRHAVIGRSAIDIEQLCLLPLAARLKALRAEARALVREGRPWQWVMDSLRPHNVRLWQSLSSREQRRFLRHAARYWDVHRHRIPASAAETIEALRRCGQLHVHLGRLRAASDAADATLQIHGAAGDHAVRVDRVIDCTGIQLDVSKIDSRPLQNMLARGQIRAGRHGLGFDTDDGGCAIDAHGRANPRLRTLGSARIGERWESIAVPELRTQAAAIADALLSAPHAR